MTDPAHRDTPTGRLADLLLRIRYEDLTPEAVTVAKQCLLDWIGVSLAARNEPLVRILVAELADEPQAQECSLIGQGRQANLLNTALINGAMSHALDFDDVITAMGHPTVPVAPAVFALAEKLELGGRASLLAFIVGVEAECRIGRYIGPSHYAKGWHGTATFGTFGAMAAAGRLYGLDRRRLLHAFGLAGTQAAGLKSAFGTMAKPLHPGKSAQNGVLSAKLARAGFTSDTDILGTPQGFADTQSAGLDVAALDAPHPRGFHVTDALFKYHAACYLTHNAIEAADELRRRHGLVPDAIASVTVRVQPGHLGVCNIEEPATGLQTKFSLRMTTAMALAGEDTSNEALFSDETARRPDLVALRRRVTVEPSSPDLRATLDVVLTDGTRLTHAANTAVPDPDLARQQERIERKFHRLAAPVLGNAAATEICAMVRRIERLDALRPLLAMCGGRGEHLSGLPLASGAR